MLFTLIKKDIIIAKSYSLCVVAVAVGLPLLFAWRQPDMGGLYALLSAVLISSVAFNLAVSEKENKYPRATALLASTPYMRTKIVGAKYSLYILIYLICCASFFIESQFIPAISVDSFPMAAAVVFLVQAVGMGIILPIQYKFGYDKTKLLGFLLFLAPIIITAAEQTTLPADIANRFDWFPAAAAPAAYIIGIAVWALSLGISKKIFDKKDLL